MATPAVEFTVVGIDKASDTFKDIGDSATRSSEKIRRSSDEAASGFETAAEGADTLASKGAQAAGALSGLGELIGGPFGGAMQVGGIAMQAAADAGDLLNVAVEGGKAALTAAGTAIKKFTAVTKLDTAAKGVATAAQWAFNAAARANPIMLVVTAITLLIGIVVLLVKNWDTVKAAGAAAWEWIKGAWSAAAAWLDEHVIQPVKRFFTVLWQAVQIVAQQAWDRVRAVWAVVAAWIDRTVVQPVKRFFTILWQAVQIAARQAWDRVRAVWAFMSGWIQNNVTGPVSRAFSSLWNGIKNVFGGARSFFSGIGDGIKSAFRGAFNAIARFWNNGPGKIRFSTPDWVPGIGGRTFAIPKIPMLAKGGDITRAGWAIVGEAGPEMLKLPTGAQVQPLPKDGNGRPTAGGGGVTINVTNHFPQAEATSVTTNRALQYAAAIGVV